MLLLLLSRRRLIFRSLRAQRIIRNRASRIVFVFSRLSAEQLPRNPLAKGRPITRGRTRTLVFFFFSPRRRGLVSSEFLEKMGKRLSKPALSVRALRLRARGRDRARSRLCERDPTGGRRRPSSKRGIVRRAVGKAIRDSMWSVKGGWRPSP